VTFDSSHQPYFSLQLTVTLPEEFEMTSSSTGTVASPPQKTALVVASGGDIDELLTSVLDTEGWNIQRAVDN